MDSPSLLLWPSARQTRLWLTHGPEEKLRAVLPPLTQLRHGRAVATLPSPVRIEPVGELGWLLVLSPEAMTASNPEHVAFTARVRELLDRAGLIERPEPVAR